MRSFVRQSIKNEKLELSIEFLNHLYFEMFFFEKKINTFNENVKGKPVYNIEELKIFGERLQEKYSKKIAVQEKTLKKTVNFLIES